eukprot:5336433-Amphidinium_carterae.1
MHDENRAKWLPWNKLIKPLQEYTADCFRPSFGCGTGVALRRRMSEEEASLAASIQTEQG